MSARDVLVVGNLRGASRSALTTAVNSLKLNIIEIADVDEAMAALEKQVWSAVLVDTTLSGASRFCTEARAQRTLFGIPFIALSPRLTDLAFLNALRWGADDVVALGSAEALTVRLGALLDGPQSEGNVVDRGEAVIADPDRRRGNGLGRSVHTAGFSVRYATDTTSARFYTTKPDVQLFVLNAELADPKTFISEAQQSGCTARWVVFAKANQIEELQKEFSATKGVVLLTTGSPPENVLFAINLLYPSEASRRGEIRALFGTVVYFRAVGDYRDECGFSYTASPQGLYVRTLAPPPADKVWVELIPPDGERRVRLVGKLAWTRPYGRHPGEPSPPGFGVRIVDGLGEDLALWSECLKALEFRAPATLVPEARFSLPAPGRVASDAVPAATASPAPSGRKSVTLLGAGLAASTSLPRVNSTASEELEPASLAPSVPQPPASTSIDRLSAAARARISTRPSLRLSLPSPVSLRREPLVKPETPIKPTEAKPRELTTLDAAAPKRVGQGRTVMGLGILQRDPLDGRPTAPPPEPQSPPEPPSPLESPRPPEPPSPPEPQPSAPNKTSATSLDDATERKSGEFGAPRLHTGSERTDGARLSPITGRTLSYGSEPPQPAENKFQAAAQALPHTPDDISDRPTLADRVSLEHAEHVARSLPPAARDLMDSLPPEALESDAPAAAPSLPPRRGDRISKTLLAATPALPLGGDADPAFAAQTDRNWVSLASIPPEQRLAEDPTSTDAKAEVLHVGANEPPQRHSRTDLGTTLPGVVVDTTLADQSIDPKPAPPPERAPFERTTAANAAERRVRQLDITDADTEVRGLPRKPGRALLPILAAIVVASGAIALLLKPAKRTDVAEPNVLSPPMPAHVDEPAAPGPLRPVESLESTRVAGGPSADPAGATGLPAPVAGSEVAGPQPGESEGSEPEALPAAPVTPPAISGAAAEDVPERKSTTAGDESEPPRDPSSLPAKNAWLFVQSPLAAHVFVHGVDTGPTNTWLETPCGTRFVRLGRSAGDWLSPGTPLVIRCRAANTVEVPQN